MTKGLRIFVGLVLAISLSLTGLGYATLTDSLSVTGTASAERTGIYITDVKLKDADESYDGATITTDTMFNLSGLTLTNDASTTSSSSAWRNDTETTVDSNYTSTIRTYSTSNGRKVTTTKVYPVTLTITVENNTNEAISYYLHDVYRTQTTDPKDAIDHAWVVSKRAPSDTEGNDSFKDGESMEIDVIFYLSETNEKAFSTSLLALTESTVNVSFDIEEADVDNVVVSNVSETFKDILNDEETYNKLTEAIMGNFDDSRFWTGTYIGNVDGSTDDDTDTIKALFGTDSIKQVIAGTEQTVTLIVKWENVDNDITTGSDFTLTKTNGSSESYYGCEMTLYMTTADLERSETFGGGEKANPVYAMVYTYGDEATGWYQLGEVYTGSAEIVAYTGGYAGGGSFNTGDWKSTESYYNLGSGQDIKAIIEAYIESIS